MQAYRRRLAIVLVLVLSGATLFQGASGCATFTGQGLLSAVNFCFLLDCSGGAGLLRPCGNPTTSVDDLLQDCPASIGEGT